MADAAYQNLTESQIQTLEQNRCRAQDWSSVRVSARFDPARVHDTVFEGTVEIGALDGSTSSSGGLPTVESARLRNVTIGDNCTIISVNGGLVNLDIGSDVLIENVGRIECDGESCFGNGYEATVLNEGGGREIRLTKETSAQIAYLTVMYRHHPRLIAQLESLAQRAADNCRSNRATIGDNVVIRNAQQITNVSVAGHATIDGALSLREGTIVSTAEAPSYIGAGVFARNFIVQAGARITDGAILDGCLVGQATRVGKKFSAENSVLFANSEGFHSEICSVFGGPYTVTHHRSTLLIAGMFSFYNAGSGTNQSNHMYKLGPLHQGILERGCKTGSFSYLLWPSRVGAFSAVIGKHLANFDTSDFPFSYISEEDGRSVLIPAMNFLTVGTTRDGRKWPTRDRRGDGEKLDEISFDVLSPFTARKMIRGRDTLRRLYAESDKSSEFVTYQGIRIKRRLLKTCARYYDLALEKYFGDVVVKRAQEQSDATIEQLLSSDPAGARDQGDWVDIGGMLCPQVRITQLCNRIAEGEIESQAALREALGEIHSCYDADEWNWALQACADACGEDVATEGRAALLRLLDRWHTSSTKLLRMVIGDAEKEFGGIVRTGFGIDGNRDEDFDQVRGTFEENAFVKGLESEIGSLDVTHAALLRRFGSAVDDRSGSG